MAKRELSEGDYEFIKQIFDAFDKDEDGKITRLELRTGLQQIGRNPTMEFVDDLMKELKIKDGIEYDDFEKCLKVIMEESDYDTGEELREAFQFFDRDNNGFIDRCELTKVLKETGEKLTDDEVAEMFRDADKNGDGKIIYEEFVKMMTEV